MKKNYRIRLSVRPSTACIFSFRAELENAPLYGSGSYSSRCLSKIPAYVWHKHTDARTQKYTCNKVWRVPLKETSAPAAVDRN